LYDSVIVNLLKTTDFSDYINSFRENSEHVWLNIIIAREDSGKEIFRIKFPEITTNICTLSLLRYSIINKDDNMISSTWYYDNLYKQMSKEKKYSLRTRFYKFIRLSYW
jgi:hypothetical protein